MTVKTTTPTFAAAYAETKRVYEAAGLGDADLSFLTEEFLTELLASLEQQTAPASLGSVSDTIAAFPPKIGELVHDAVFLGGDRVIGYEASETGSCQMLIPIDTNGAHHFHRTCESGGGAIWRIMPV